jgi:dTDP-glucose 4,6-dehydratase
MKIKKILITGGAGFIGSNFIRYLIKKKPQIEILNFDALTYAGNLENLRLIKKNPHYTFIKGNICDKLPLKSAVQNFLPDVIVNFAAETHVDRSIQDPDIFIQTNIVGVQNLLKVCLDNNILRYIQVSTDEVYGSLGESGLFTESSPLDPHSPYSASKASADLLTKAYHDTYGFPAIITRCSNNYGPYQFPEKFIPLIILCCLAGKEIPIYGDGLNIRDWIHVDDHCAAIDAVIEKGAAGEIYNIGANNQMTNISMVRSIIQVLSAMHPEKKISEDLITYVEDRPGHDRRYAIDSTKIRKNLGWRPAIRFEEGLRKTIQWYLDNPKWVSSVLNKDYLAYYEKNYGTRKKLRRRS